MTAAGFAGTLAVGAMTLAAVVLVAGVVLAVSSYRGDK
jgi:hypothetical protein